MDLALAHRVAGLLAEKGVKLDPWQSVALWHACREAKEILLADEGPETHSISVLGRGSKLIGGTVSVQVDRAALFEAHKHVAFGDQQVVERIEALGVELRGGFLPVDPELSIF